MAEQGNQFKDIIGKLYNLGFTPYSLLVKAKVMYGNI